MARKQIVYGLLDRPPFPILLLAGAQHVLTLFGATTLVPLIFGPAMGMDVANVAKFISCVYLAMGIATLVQTTPLLGTGLPIVQGSSFSFIPPIMTVIGIYKAMGPDVIVIRHPSSGAARFLAELLPCGIVNGGDGWHAHPTQALLDCYSLRQAWQNRFAGRTLLILGDIAHSRVARSNMHLLTMLGVKVRLCAPRTLLPAGVDHWPVEIYTELDKAVRDVDAVMCLRLQLERQQAGLLPDLAEYSRRFCLGSSQLALAAPEAKVLHPGPMNRGLEISNDIADAPASLVLNQVAAGVATRMAVLYLLATRNDGVRA